MSRLYDANGKWHYACYAQVITVTLHVHDHIHAYTHTYIHILCCASSMRVNGSDRFSMDDIFRVFLGTVD